MLTTHSVRKKARLLALVLLALAGGWMDAAALRMDSVAVSEHHYAYLCDSSNGEIADANQKQGSDAVRPSRSSSLVAGIKPAGDGGAAQGFSKNFGSGLLPAGGSSDFSHSKSALKHRLCVLLTRAEWQQRVSLYPKHGFW